MPTDEAYIALLIDCERRLARRPKSGEMLGEDPEIYSAINNDKNVELGSVAE